MKCPKCGGKTLVAHVHIHLTVPLGGRRGTIVPRGTLNNTQIKDAWDLEGTVPKAVKGPIECIRCKAKFVYHTGAHRPLKAVE